ncbi:ribbon-helix-helix domain-containing protein [Nanoarchaeota archaeon]
MATEMITLKLEEKFLENIDKTVDKEGYQSRTEFIRDALRKKLEDSKLKEDLASIARLKGASNKKTTQKEYEKSRRIAFKLISKKLR